MLVSYRFEKVFAYRKILSADPDWPFNNVMVNLNMADNWESYFILDYVEYNITNLATHTW